MVKYASLVKQKLNTLSAWKLEHVPRDCNERADALAAVAASLPIRETVFPPIYYQLDSSILHAPSKPDRGSSLVLDGPHTTIHNNGELPNDRDKAHKVQIQSTRFSMIDRQLYK